MTESDGCGKGYYRDNETGECKKSIRIKRKGIYGDGFLSEPQSEQYDKIREEEKRESPQRVDEQMSALNSFTAHEPEHHEAAHRDLEYAETMKPDKKNVKRDHETGLLYYHPNGHPASAKYLSSDEEKSLCGPGEEYVAGYVKEDGTEVNGYCREKKEFHDSRSDGKSERRR